MESLEQWTDVLWAALQHRRKVEECKPDFGSRFCDFFYIDVLTPALEAMGLPRDEVVWRTSAAGEAVPQITDYARNWRKVFNELEHSRDAVRAFVQEAYGDIQLVYQIRNSRRLFAAGRDSKGGNHESQC